MNQAENQSRKNRKPGPGVERLVAAARLGALGKEIGVDIKRHRDPGAISGQLNFGQDGQKEKRQEKDETIIVKRGF